MRNRLLACVLAAALLASSGGPAEAGGGLSIAPITIEFARGVTARSIEVSNPGDQPIDIQVRVFSWRIDETGEQYEPSREIAFSPPMFHLAAGARQIVRIVSLSPPSPQERAYRLFVDQLPGATTGGRLEMPVRMVLPVFVAAAGAGEAQHASPGARLSWRAVRADGGRLRLTATNRGVRRVKLINLSYLSNGKSHMIQSGLAGYVLAGQFRTWTVPLPDDARDLTVKAETDEAPLSAPVALPAP